jgi:glucosamine--fructose-6-phosphate aminotransferase (isomerizing)
MSQHYHMIDYIHESPAALRRTFDSNADAIQTIVDRVRDAQIERIFILGIGSSYTAAVMAEPMFRYHCPLPTHVLPATELDYYLERLVDSHTLAVVVSRSGERDWVVNALKATIEQGAFGVAMTGSADSLLAQNAELVLLTGEGPEITFPKTKSVMACAALMMRLALALSDAESDETQARLDALLGAPDGIERVIATLEPSVQQLLPEIQAKSPVVVSGTGSNYGAALEMAVKLQETAYVATHADDTGDVLHGPLGAMDGSWLLVPLVTAYDYEINKQLLTLAGKFGVTRLSIAEPGLDMAGLAEHTLTLPDRVDPMLTALTYLPVLQMMTYYWALAKGLNPDVPDSMRDILDAILPEGREEPELR